VNVSDASLIGRSASVAINVRPPQLAATFAILNYRRDVACWHIADIPAAPAFVCSWGNSGYAAYFMSTRPSLLGSY
jgi:hypothetical protein